MRRRRNTYCVHTFFKGLIHSTDYLLFQFTFNSFFFNPFMMVAIEKVEIELFFVFFVFVFVFVICWLINFVQFFYVFPYNFIGSIQYCQWKQLDLLGDFLSIKNHFPKQRMKKSDLSRIIGGFYKNPSISTSFFFFFYGPKMEDLVMEAQNIFPNLFIIFLIKPDPHHYS